LNAVKKKKPPPQLDLETKANYDSLWNWTQVGGVAFLVLCWLLSTGGVDTLDGGVTVLLLLCVFAFCSDRHREVVLLIVGVIAIKVLW
jgi:hypothetical protein